MDRRLGVKSVSTLVQNEAMSDDASYEPVTIGVEAYLSEEYARADDASRGVIWPTVDPVLVGKSGTAWQIFPNFQIGHAVNNSLCYSARPYGYDPNKCIFEAAVYELYPKGEEPKTEWEYLPANDPRWGSVLPQDFSNMAAVQRDMKSGGFRGPLPNPKAEGAVINRHRTLAKYMGTGASIEGLRVREG